MKPKSADLKRKYLTPRDLARRLKCSERTARELCKSGEIREARRTPGGHWRIKRPLSAKTVLFLEKQRGEWPFDGSGEFEGEWEPDIAECLILPQLIRTKAKLRRARRDPDYLDTVAEPLRKKFDQMLVNGEPFFRIFLIGEVAEFWRQHERPPTIVEIARQMGLSRSTFYRRYTRRDVTEALMASRKAKHELPDPRGLDAAQRASFAAKKPSFASLQRNLYD